MAMWGVVTMLGPITGPTLGGLADRRILLAMGILHQPAGRHIVRDRTDDLSRKTRASDNPPAVRSVGLPLLAIALGTFQLMLDRVRRSTGSAQRRSSSKQLSRPSLPPCSSSTCCRATIPFCRSISSATGTSRSASSSRPSPPSDGRDRDPAAALPPATQGLSGVHYRHRHGAARRRHHDVDVRGVAPDRAHRCTLADRDRPGPCAACRSTT